MSQHEINGHRRVERLARELSHRKGHICSTTYRLWKVSLVFDTRGKPNLYTTKLSYVVHVIILMIQQC